MTRSWCRGLLPLFCGAFVLCASPAGAQVVQPAEVESGSVIVTTEAADVREGPSADFNVITIVGKGEIFRKLGRTGAWYYVQINGDTFGWVSGRAISRYSEGDAPPPPVAEADEEPRDEVRDPYYPYYPWYPYYPGFYYDSSFFFWGQPYYSWDWYYYNNYRRYDHDRWYYDDHYRRDRREGPREDYRPRSNTWQGDGNNRRGGDSGRHVPSPPGPRLPRGGARPRR